MAKIQIIKKKDSTEYKYIIINDENNITYISENVFATQKGALEAARKHFNNNPSPIHVTKTEHTHTPVKKEKNFKIKKLSITDGGCRLLSAGIVLTIVVTSMCGIRKIIRDLKSKFPEVSETNIEMDNYENSILITSRDCNFKNIHVVIRTAKNETIGVGTTTSDMLTRLGVSNEIVGKDSDLSQKVSNAIKNTDNNIVVINLEAGYENGKNNTSIIMGDSSNRRKYSSDILTSCINASLNEYSLDPIIRSGQGSGIWRSQTYIEEELNNSALINDVSQLTIDLPIEVGKNEILKNDAAASIVEGIMRWTTLDVTERYKNVYYTAQYGDTIVSISDDFGISIKDMEINSDINMHKGVKVGNTILVGKIPMVATNNVRVYNPCTTIDPTNIEEIINTYTVQSGDTLTKIANMYGVKPEDIIVPSGNPNNIYIGDTLYITTYSLYETHKKTNYILEKQI